MSTKHLPPKHISAALVAIAAMLAGCTPGPGWTDKDPGIVGDLKIDIPETATNIVGKTGSGVDFLMPNDQWRDYVAKSYPEKQLSRTPLVKETDGSVPAMCLPAFRSGTKLEQWSTTDRIQFRDTDKSKIRGVTVTPDCEPGKTYVQWILVDAR